MIYTTALIPFVLVALVCVCVHALPFGAPVCTTGKAAPGDPHTSAGRNPQTGPLSLVGLIVKIGDVILDAATPIVVKPNEDLRVVVTSPEGNTTFRGALLIVSKIGFVADGTFSLTAADATKLQISTVCPTTAASGVTHVDRELKTSVEATIRFDENVQDLLLDVNIVLINRLVSEGGSAYYYSQYKINVEGPTKAPTVAPTGGSNCGLFGLGIFCPFSFCGFFGRLLLGPRDC